MASKKISQLQRGSAVRPDDIIPFSTGLREGEAPSTKKISKTQLMMSEGAASLYDTILELGAIHYWPMSLPFLGSGDEVSKTKYLSTPGLFNKPIVSGIVAGAYKDTIAFDGVSYIDTGVRLNSMANLSVTFTVRPTSGARHLVGCTNPAATSGFFIFNGVSSDQNAPLVRVYTGSGQIDLVPPTNSLPLNNSSNVTWTFNSTTGHVIYVNGVQVFTSTNTAQFIAPSVDFIIGGGLNPPPNWATIGILQDVAIFNRVLSPSEVLELSNAVLGV
jgi:hypothetical protein